MRYVEAQGLRASVLGLGAWQFGSPEWGWGDGFGPAEAQAIVDRARQLGVTLIDTAETYGKGESERVLGHILARPEVRDSIVLASKVAPIWPTRDRVKVAAHASLERLGTDRLDLYQVHWPNPLVPQSSTMAGMRALQAGGLVRHVGVSNYTLGLWRAAEAALGGPVVSNQVQYNLLRRRPERELRGFAAGAGRLIIAYSPLAQGVLSGRYSAGNPPGGVRGDRARRRRVPAPAPGRRPVPPRHAGKRERAGDPPRPLAGPAVATRPRPARVPARRPSAGGVGQRQAQAHPGGVAEVPFGVHAELVHGGVEHRQVDPRRAQRLDGVVVQVAGQTPLLALLGGDELVEQAAALALGALQVGDVHRHADHAGHVVAVAVHRRQWPVVDVEDRLAVGVLGGDLAPGAQLLAGQQALEVGGRLGDVAAKLRVGAVQPLPGRDAHAVEGAPLREGADAVAVVDGDHDRGVGDHRAQPRLVGLEGPGGLVALGHVLRLRQEPQRPVPAVAQHGDREQQLDHAAVGALGAAGDLERWRRLLARAEPLADAAQVLEAGRRVHGAGDQLHLLVAEQLAQGLVDAQEAPVQRDQRHADGGLLECQAQIKRGGNWSFPRPAADRFCFHWPPPGRYPQSLLHSVQHSAGTIGQERSAGAAAAGEVHLSRVTETILSLHGWVALLVVFLLPALEASAFYGVLFPGEIAVILGGVLAFQHRVDLGAVTAVGAVVGDTVGYLVGRRWGRRMLHGSLRRFVKAHHLDQAEAFLGRHGGKAVFFGRWTAALRALIPGLAGMSGVSYRTFAIWNVLGGGLWAATFVLVGFVAGEGWRKVEEIAKRASLVLLLIVVLVAGIVLAGRWIAQHPERVRAAIQRQRPGGALGLSLTLGLLAIAIAGWTFGAVAQAVLASEDLTQFDGFVQHFFSGHREPWLTTVLHDAVGLGGAGLLLAIGLAVGLGFRLARGRWQPLLLLLGAYAGSELLALSVDALVKRPRPPRPLVAADGFAFPSREATAAAALYGMLVALAAIATSRWSLRVAAATGAMLTLALLGLGQVYLGANWLSDVLGGYALGGLWLFVLLTMVHTLLGWRASSRGGRTERAEVKA